ncbi:hypothetical protein PR202_gb28155 [Eleusine coracana subsp. coracana]|uniref:Uncharacterized protein n=1 Tax=Eleusine coracana subsp. coracana TaxID=191504 RepID=A0AAV5FY45_ELECO|nr:hypothetical protein QOZ80_6AG0547590 [Eleusine coracana subsp. coracana]GJN39061.1 hypothetical protein PR202_gb28155 [Eleusine coracana subsp. coracana]
MAECNGGGARAPAPAARGSRGCGLALGRLVRKLRRQSRTMLCTASPSARPSSSSARRCQYDPLSYARNFDFGTALDGYSFASRFVLATSARQQQ